jgi:pantetheine-phosphate adenylyltransferase
MPIKVCLGGTFNVIHDGHLALLFKAFTEGDELYVGLTGDAMASGRRSVPVQDYNTRLKNLTEALSKLSKGKRFWIFRIDDEIGPAARENYDVLVVSKETLRGAEKINLARAAGCLKPLKVVVIDMVLAQGKPISSTRVIRGQIDSRGNPKDNP